MEVWGTWHIKKTLMGEAVQGKVICKKKYYKYRASKAASTEYRKWFTELAELNSCGCK